MRRYPTLHVGVILLLIGISVFVLMQVIPSHKESTVDIQGAAPDFTLKSLNGKVLVSGMGETDATMAEAYHVRSISVIAHRGACKRAPENTMSAFKMALPLGADGIELDVHMTRDHELVVIHDETLDRTTNGSGWVKDHSLPEIQQLECKAKGNEHHPIPTLSGVLEWVSETHCFINVELKNDVIAYPQMEERVVALIERYHMEDRVILSSFNHDSLRRLHQYRPALKLGMLFDKKISKPWIQARELGASAIHPYHRLVTQDMVRECHRHGIQVRPYTVDSERGMKRLLDMGVDGIITNVPDRLRQVLSQRRA